MNGATLDYDTKLTTRSDAISLSASTALIVNSTITSTVGGESALRLLNNVALTDGGSHGSLVGSTISGMDSGVNMSAGSSLNLNNSTVRSTVGTAGSASFNGAVMTFGGGVIATNGSVIDGATNGITMSLAASTAPVAGDGQIVIDGSTVIGHAGSAIAVNSAFDFSTVKEASILVRNGSSLQGSDGNILSVTNPRNLDTAPTINFFVESSVLDGNVTVGADGSVGNVTLSNGGRINGTFNNVTQATLGNGGHWQLTGDSTVNALDVQSGGVIELGNGTAFHTLTVAGNYTGSGGTLLFNTVLGGNTSASDKLVIGGETSGQTYVRVNNVGGAGAQTDQGI
ncbi:hypothetical protein CEK00_09440 [Stenotrophomonas maltophilia]|uniref:Autochaperone domain-containing protein n=2 Tax=Stenotrophomonas maltophilia TaxID=40324 RepID=A0A270MXP7_STEMA|nr:hypothetical protein CEK00_21760 [Stenotrophomonas maltophilia]PAM71806.1 hypothetical protein CEK00_09440 [Stenotrophomonas maltophilia]